MSTILEVFIPGKAAPGGSKKAFVNPKTGKIVVTDDAKNNAGWRDRVAVFAATRTGCQLVDGPLEVVATFVVERPKGHYGTGRNAGKVRPTAPAWPTSKPDATKLWRAAEDALTGVVWHDDAQIVRQRIEKRYGDRPGLALTVRTLGTSEAC